MSRAKKNFWDFTINTHELKEIILLGLLVTIAIFLLRSAFDRAAQKTVVKISDLSTVSYQQKI
ncbi:MAG: hypothetical protein D3910_06010 [Candidatus Electrothrix sp. ATG2]|nr:hypothetical protein [Candidatus Electrothrix sp. ATG2]